MKQFLLVLLFLAVNSGFSAVVNILNNGSFEMDSSAGVLAYDLRTTSLNGWTFLDEGNTGGTASGANGFYVPNAFIQYFNTPFDERFLIFGNGSPNRGNALYQDVNLDAGFYRASIWTKGFGYTQPIGVQFGVLWTAKWTANETWWHITPILHFEDAWAEYAFEIEVKSPTTARFLIRDITPNGLADGADVFVDNAILQAVPEPSSLSLLVASGAVLMAGRRRRQN